MAEPVTAPEAITTEQELDDALSHPSPALVSFVRSVSSPLVIFGAGGKMGPSLALLARRAADAAGHRLRIIAVSRFGAPDARAWFEERGIQTQACDVLDPDSVEGLPDTENLLYLVGLKFGTADNPALTWASNTLAPAHICHRYPGSRVVALSTGNVYPFTSVDDGGSRESDRLTPLGEYPNAAVGRERIFQFCSERHGTRIALLRLYYAVELRYGVLVDIGCKVADGKPIDLTNGVFNCIWQGDANERVLRALALTCTPPSVWNLCRPEPISTRDTALRFGTLLGRPPIFQGTESDTALLGDGSKLCRALGEPSVTVERMMRWIAHWIRQGGRNLNLPTHFEVRDGVY